MKNSEQNKKQATKGISFDSYIIVGIIAGVILSTNFSGENLLMAIIFLAIFGLLEIPSLVACAVSLIVAKLSGYKFNRFVGYIFVIDQKNGRLSFKIAPRWMAPTTTFYPTKKKIGSVKTVMVAAFNIVTYVLGAILSFVLYGITNNIVFLSLAMAFSMAALQSSVLPNGGNCQNNLAFIKEILHKEEKAAVHNNILTVNYLRSTETRFRDMDKDLFEEFDRDVLGESLYYSNQLLRFCYLCDSNQFEDALAISDSIINSPMLENLSIQRGSIRMDIVIYSLLLGVKNDSVAFNYNHEDSKAFREKFENTSCIYVVNYAYALLYEKDVAKAKEYLNSYNEYVKNTSKMNAEREKEIIAMIDEQNNKRT